MSRACGLGFCEVGEEGYIGHWCFLKPTNPPSYRLLTTEYIFVFFTHCEKFSVNCVFQFLTIGVSY